LVASAFSDRILVLDAATGAPRDSVTIDPRPFEVDQPHGLAAAPDGRHWYATVAHGEATLWKYELPGSRLVGRVKLGIAGAARIGITPDGRRAFVPDYYRDGGATPSEVAVVELEDLTVSRRLTVCGGPHDAEVAPDGRLVAVTCSTSDEVVLLDTGTLEEVRRFVLGHDGGGVPCGAGASGVKPLNLVWAPAGDWLYVTLARAGRVQALARSGGAGPSVEVGAGPAQLALTPDGGTLVVANRGDGSVSLVGLSPLIERRRIDLGVDHPHGVALSPDGGTAFVGFEGATTSLGGVVALEIATGEVLWRRRAGRYDLGVIYLTAID